MKEFLLPIRNLVIHPGTPVPVYIDNPASISCIEAAEHSSNRVVLVPQHSWTYPTSIKDIYNVGTLGEILHILKMPDGTVHAIIKTISAVTLSNIVVEDGIFSAETDEIVIVDSPVSEQVLSLRDKIAENIQPLSVLYKIKTDKLRSIIQQYPLHAFIDSVVDMLDLDTDVGIKILTTNTWLEKLTILLEQVNIKLETAKIEDNINKRIHQQMEQGRKEAILQEKLRAIQREMGDDYDIMDTESVKKRIEKAHIPADVRAKALSEWKRMKSLSPMSSEGGLIKNYLDELLSMPWNKLDKSSIDLSKARAVLDSQHSGMRDVKERILEHMAVIKKTGLNSGTILCFVGAPGVGKTSLCKSIADALGRKYQRISLGGISDESHFRGHRKTYIGAQTGRIMDALKRCKTANPVIVLDEIDKMGRDWRGDPESALLEILDPEQNKTFRDHYLDVDFDLSNVLFIATANSLNMSAALKDRMEIINIPSYNETEKLQIAREHLISRVADANGWAMENVHISDDAILHLIRNYTCEQGVRQLQRELATILRKQLLDSDGQDLPTDFTVQKIDDFLSARNNLEYSKKIGFGMSVQQ